MEWGQVVGMGGMLLLIVGYVLWLFVLQPMFAAPAAHVVWLPLVQAATR